MAAKDDVNVVVATAAADNGTVLLASDSVAVPAVSIELNGAVLSGGWL